MELMRGAPEAHSPIEGRQIEGFYTVVVSLKS